MTSQEYYLSMLKTIKHGIIKSEIFIPQEIIGIHETKTVHRQFSLKLIINVKVVLYISTSLWKNKYFY